MFIVAAKLSLFTLSSPHLLHLNLPLPSMCLSVYLPNNNKSWQTFSMGPKTPLIWFHSGNARSHPFTPLRHVNYPFYCTFRFLEQTKLFLFNFNFNNDILILLFYWFAAMYALLRERVVKTFTPLMLNKITLLNEVKAIVYYINWFLHCFKWRLQNRIRSLKLS